MNDIFIAMNGDRYTIGDTVKKKDLNNYCQGEEYVLKARKGKSSFVTDIHYTRKHYYDLDDVTVNKTLASKNVMCKASNYFNICTETINDYLNTLAYFKKYDRDESIRQCASRLYGWNSKEDCYQGALNTKTFKLFTEMKNQLHIDDWVIAMVYVDKSPEELEKQRQNAVELILEIKKKSNYFVKAGIAVGQEMQEITASEDEINRAMNGKKKRRVLAYAKVTNLGFDNIGLRAYPYYPDNNTYADVVVDDDITCKCTKELSSELDKFVEGAN